MADEEISGLTELAETIDPDDWLVVVDRSDTSVAPTGKTKKIKASNAVSGGGGSGTTRYLWTLGGTNDLADFDQDGGERRTHGTGPATYGDYDVLTTTFTQAAGPPTVWSPDGTHATWTSPTMPVNLGDHVRVYAQMGWTRTANSLIAAEQSSPSLMGDVLADESCAMVRAGIFLYSDTSEYASAPNTDVAWDYYSAGWIFSSDQSPFTAEFVVLDPATTEIFAEFGIRGIWGNAAGIARLGPVVFEITPLEI